MDQMDFIKTELQQGNFCLNILYLLQFCLNKVHPALRVSLQFCLNKVHLAYRSVLVAVLC